jgi:hypothetical protein
MLFLSDHGSRFAIERQTPQGDLEEKSPFFSIYLPESYRKAFPEKYANLERNSQQLSTCFDIHSTIRELTCSQNVVIKSKEKRALSLLSNIPVNRSCDEIGIAMQYCTCEIEWTRLDSNSQITRLAVDFLMNHINKNLLGNALAYCYPLKLTQLLDARIGTVKNDKYVKIKFQTGPNQALYDVILKFFEEKFYLTSENSISRINPYGNQPKCLEFVPPSKNLTHDLRKFCLCKRKRPKFKLL